MEMVAQSKTESENRLNRSLGSCVSNSFTTTKIAELCPSILCFNMTFTLFLTHSCKSIDVSVTSGGVLIELNPEY